MSTSGQRVRQLRESRNLGLKDLARAIEMTEDKLSKSESGKRRLTAGELFAIASVLQSSVRYLMGMEDNSVLAMAARVANEITGPNLEAIADRARQLLEVDHLLRELGVTKQPEPTKNAQVLLDLGRTFDKPEKKSEANEAGSIMAEKTRNVLELGNDAISNLVDLAEREFGLDVECASFGKDVFGLCVHGREFALILASTSVTSGRLRFTLAHEIGHHIFGDPTPILVERASNNVSLVERRANSFAANLLMPKSQLTMLVGNAEVSDELLVKLMQYFDVSLSTLVLHLVDCGILSFHLQVAYLAKQSKELIEKFGDSGYPNPTQENLPDRAPARLLKAARDAESQGKIGPKIASSLLRSQRKPAPDLDEEQYDDAAREVSSFFANI